MKQKPIDHILLIYACILVAVLTIGAISQTLSDYKNLLTLLFLLPMAGYLCFQVIISIYRLKYKQLTPTPTQKPTPTKRQLVNLPQKQGFLHQSSPAFLVTIGLFTLTLTSTITLSILYH